MPPSARVTRNALIATHLLVLSQLDHASAFVAAPCTFTSQRTILGHFIDERFLLYASPEPLTSAIDSFFQTQPYIAAFITCSLKAGTADFVAQSQPQLLSKSDSSTVDDEGGLQLTSNDLSSADSSSIDQQVNSLDLARTTAFVIYGGIYQGLFQEFLYGHLFPNWFGSDESFRTVATSVLADQFFFAPFTCLPCAYIIKAFIMNSGKEDDRDKVLESDIITGSLIDTAKKGLEKYKQDVLERGLLLKYWAIWFPVQTITFSVIPERYRILFIACVSFFWMFLLSAISSDTTTSTKNDGERVVVVATEESTVTLIEIEPAQQPII